jgi:hypothetical protein
MCLFSYDTMVLATNAAADKIYPLNAGQFADATCALPSGAADTYFSANPNFAPENRHRCKSRRLLCSARISIASN